MTGDCLHTWAPVTVATILWQPATLFGRDVVMEKKLDPNCIQYVDNNQVPSMKP